MDPVSLRGRIRQKLADGHLRRDTISRTRTLSRPSNGETCDGCDEVIGPLQFVMEAASESVNHTEPVLRFHVACLNLWIVERTLPES